MRVVLIFVSLFTLLISLATCEYSDCDAENPSPGLILHRLELPETLHIGRLNKINVNASLLEDLEPDDLIAMNIHKKIWFQKVWAPCILGQGSCTKTFQQWFNGSKKFVCEFLEELGQPCEARIRQNTYARNIDVEIDPILIPRVFRKVVPGNYEVTIKIMKPDKSTKACIFVKLGLEIEESVAKLVKLRSD